MLNEIFGSTCERDIKISCYFLKISIKPYMWLRYFCDFI